MSDHAFGQSGLTETDRPSQVGLAEGMVRQPGAAAKAVVLSDTNPKGKERAT